MLHEPNASSRSSSDGDAPAWPARLLAALWVAVVYGAYWLGYLGGRG